jgi:hypothetical protein
VSLFVQKRDIAAFTGKRSREDQSAELSRRGVRFTINSCGDIIILRSTLEEVVTGKTTKPARRHNIEALRREKSAI